MFSVRTPASDLTLLSSADLREAIGLEAGDTSKDTLLANMGTEAAAAIAVYCCVARDGINPPTLKSEAVKDIFRLNECRSRLYLSRRYVTAISSVVIDGTTMASTDYEFQGPSGAVARLVSDYLTFWSPGKITIEYTAGFSTVPAEIRAAAKRLVASMYSDHGRDPNLKRERVDGIGEQEFWVGTKAAEFFPQEVKDLLDPFKNWLV